MNRPFSMTPNCQYSFIVSGSDGKINYFLIHLVTLADQGTNNLEKDISTQDEGLH